MNRQGQVIRKLAPPQGIRFGNTLCAELVVAPRGIIDAAVSPDGTKVAYVSQWNFHHPDCPRVVDHTQLWVVNIDGTNAVEIEAADGSNLEGPSWLSNSRLLMNRLSSNGTYFADLPGTVATEWAWGGEEPDLKAGKLASRGQDANFNQALFLWTSDGPPAEPVYRCGYGGPSGGSGARFAAPSWASDGSSLVWEEGDGVADEEGEGVKILAVGDLAAGCPPFTADQLLVPGGTQPDWGPAPLGNPTFSVNDVSVVEGDSGTTQASFTVTRSPGVGTAAVSWFTADGSATSPSDYVGVVPTRISFADGQTTLPVSVTVNGDTDFEAAEGFWVKLTRPSAGTTILDASGRGTIANDDGNKVSVNDVWVREGHTGTTTATFTVSRSSGTGTTSVSWLTANGTAAAPSDYAAVAATRLTFNPTETTKTVSVTVNGDTVVEPAEAFFVKLRNPSVGSRIVDDTGRGTIVNDDYSSSFSVDDVSVVEGFPGAGMVTVTFTVTRSGSGDASVKWATADGTAVSGSDYEGSPLPNPQRDRRPGHRSPGHHPVPHRARRRSRGATPASSWSTAPNG